METDADAEGDDEIGNLYPNHSELRRAKRIDAFATGKVDYHLIGHSR